MKINFENLTIYTDIAKTNTQVVNMKAQLADAIYQNGFGVAAHALALKIYNSKGDCELTDEEYNMLVQFVESKCTPMVIDAIKVKQEA
jgi:hypothetical protein